MQITKIIYTMKSYILSDLAGNIALVRSKEREDLGGLVLEAVCDHYAEEGKILLMKESKVLVVSDEGSRYEVTMKEVTEYTAKNMKYYLFGEEAVRTFNDDGLDTLVSEIEHDDLDYSTGAYDFNDENQVHQLMRDNSGWGDYSLLSEDEYEHINSEE